mmetsp:Transcript_1359/g.2786  ORF Transcript_1359/g.2786 Transcript_1359/m.2786 type:complete len:301 (+) Transcript_1359:1305-2207(+)
MDQSGDGEFGSLHLGFADLHNGAHGNDDAENQEVDEHEQDGDKLPEERLLRLGDEEIAEGTLWSEETHIKVDQRHNVEDAQSGVGPRDADGRDDEHDVKDVVEKGQRAKRRLATVRFQEEDGDEEGEDKHEEPNKRRDALTGAGLAALGLLGIARKTLATPAPSRAFSARVAPRSVTRVGFTRHDNGPHLVGRSPHTVHVVCRGDNVVLERDGCGCPSQAKWARCPVLSNVCSLNGAINEAFAACCSCWTRGAAPRRIAPVPRKTNAVFWTVLLEPLKPVLFEEEVHLDVGGKRGTCFAR